MSDLSWHFDENMFFYDVGWIEFARKRGENKKYILKAQKDTQDQLWGWGKLHWAHKLLRNL